VARVNKRKGPEWEDLELDLDRDLCKASTWFYDDDNDFKRYIVGGLHG
jgi:hypothetical protein